MNDPDRMNLICENCYGKSFYTQDGLYFCEECNYQCINLVEIEHEEFTGAGPRHTLKLSKKNNKKNDDLLSRRLTSFEEYNFILRGLIEEVLRIEEIPNFRMTCLRLWITYLRESEAAFFSKELVAPRLFSYFRKADAQILYNMKPKPKKKYIRKRKRVQVEDNPESSLNFRRRRKQMRASEKIISQQLSDSTINESQNTSSLFNLSIETIMSEHDDLEVEIELSKHGKESKKNTQRYKSKRGGSHQPVGRMAKCLIKGSYVPQFLNGQTLIFIIYSALNLCESSIQLTDVIRLALEGQLSYYKCKALLPEELIELGVPLSFEECHNYNLLEYQSARSRLSYFVNFIPDLRMSFKTPDLIQLCKRYVDEMNLPNEFNDYILRMVSFLPPKMQVTRLKEEIPNYEGRAMAFIIFILKLLFGIDGRREEEMSRAAHNVNCAIELLEIKDQKKIFVYREWKKFIEYRRHVVDKYYHPSLYKKEFSKQKSYISFNEALNTLNPCIRNDSVKPKACNALKTESKINAQEILAKLIKKHSEVETSIKMGQLSFHPTMTPYKDNLAIILENDKKIEHNREILSNDFSNNSCEPYLVPQKVKDLLESYGVFMDIKTSTFPTSYDMQKARTAPNLKDFKQKFFLNFNSTDAEWREDVKARQRLEKEANYLENIKSNESRMNQTLEKRKEWRQRINRKIKSPTETFDEDNNLLTDEELETVDSDLDEIEFDTTLNDNIARKIYETKEKESSGLTLVTPDFNLWHRRFSINDCAVLRTIPDIEELPKSFKWLLGVASNILNQPMSLIFYQVMILEHQYVDIWQPLELVKDVLVRKRETRSVIGRKLESMW